MAQLHSTSRADEYQDKNRSAAWIFENRRAVSGWVFPPRRRFRRWPASNGSEILHELSGDAVHSCLATRGRGVRAVPPAISGEARCGHSGWEKVRKLLWSGAVGRIF